MNKQFPPSGVLFKNNKKRDEKSPDMWGDLEISKELLRELIELANTGQPIKMSVSAYRRESEKVGVYLKLSAKKQNDPGKSRGRRTEDEPF